VGDDPESTYPPVPQAINRAHLVVLASGTKLGIYELQSPLGAGGMLFLDSGYDAMGGIPGNVLLAFSVNGR
jgi:hypothetical protein